MRKQKVKIQGRVFSSITEAAQVLMMTHAQVRHRCYSPLFKYRAWTIIKPVECPEKIRVKGIEVVAEGRMYDSYVHAADVLEVVPTTIRNRVYREEKGYYLFNTHDNSILNLNA